MTLFYLHRLLNTENTLLQTREEEGVTFERTLVAFEFIDWLLQEGEMVTREEAEQLGRRLLEHGIIQHGEKTGSSEGRESKWRSRRRQIDGLWKTSGGSKHWFWSHQTFAS